MVSSWFSVLLTKADEGFGSDARDGFCVM